MMSCYLDQDRKGCTDCEYEDRNQSEFPCNVCENAYTNWYKKKKDMVEVIRCRDCTHHAKESGLCRIWSKYGTITTSEDGYCYKGER